MSVANKLRNFTYRASACKDNNVNLDSICIASNNEDTDEFVATDGYRIVIHRLKTINREIFTGSNYSGMYKIAIPTRLISVIEAARRRRIDLGSSIKISSVADSAIFRPAVGNLILLNMKNQFVNYGTLEKYDYSLSFAANIDDLKSAIGIISYVANATDQVRCRFMIDTEKQTLLMVIIGRNNSVSCNAVIRINLANKADNSIKTYSFYANPLYILDFLKLTAAIKSQNNSQNDKLLLFSLSEDEFVPIKISTFDSSYMYYLMKMKNNP